MERGTLFVIEWFGMGFWNADRETWVPVFFDATWYDAKNGLPSVDGAHVLVNVDDLRWQETDPNW